RFALGAREAHDPHQTKGRRPKSRRPKGGDDGGGGVARARRPEVGPAQGAQSRVRRRGDRDRAGPGALQGVEQPALRLRSIRARARSPGRKMTLTFDEVLNAAREKAGVAAPASDSWREGLEILLRDHARADTLSERGWGMMKNRYVETLAARMSVDDYLRKNPAVTQAPIRRPVFILGM